MITGSPIPDGAGWVPVPNQTARDPRLNRRDLGLLVELLSYPSGWDNNADRLSAKRGEGRDATRRSMARLEEAGYVIHLRYRAERGRWLTASFAGSTPEVARSLAEAWLVEHPDSNAKEKPSSHRRTGFQSSENQASADQSSETQAFSTSKTDDNTDKNTDGQDQDAASAASRWSDANASDIGDATASPRDGDQATGFDQGTPRRRPARRQSLADYLAAMDSDEVDEILIELECSRGGIVDWALPIAREALRLTDDADPHDEPGGRLAVKTLALALPALYKQGGLPVVVDDALAGFDWPYQFDWYTETAPRERRERPHTSYAYAKKGVDTRKILDDVYAAVSSASKSEVMDLTAAFRENRPRIFRECTQQALDQLELTDADAGSLGAMRLALKYGLLHYGASDKWPLWLLPASVRPAEQEVKAA